MESYIFVHFQSFKSITRTFYSSGFSELRNRNTSPKLVHSSVDSAITDSYFNPLKCSGVR